MTSVSGISVGDKISLDIDSVGHGIETVAVAGVGSAASVTNLTENVNPGATKIRVRFMNGFAVGDKIMIGAPTRQETVTVTAMGTPGPQGSGIDFTPALKQAHIESEQVVMPGTGLELAAPLKFNHAANLPFSNRGTGISFTPATAFAHSSNEPVQALGTGIALDKPLSNDHGINAAVRDAAVKTAGYRGSVAPNQWFGGPEMTTTAIAFGRFSITFREGSMVLRDAAGLVVDSLNYGGIVEPWAAEGYQGTSGSEASGCHAPAPGGAAGFGGMGAAAGTTDSSAGRSPDGADTDSNCNDFVTQAATTLAGDSAAGATNVKVASVEAFSAGQQITIGEGGDGEAATIATVGTAGATTANAALAAGAKVIPVAGMNGFRDGETITIDSGANAETAVVASVRRFGGLAIVVTSGLKHEHVSGTPVAGSGITLSAPLTRAHAAESHVYDSVPTPGAPNRYARKSR